MFIFNEMVDIKQLQALNDVFTSVMKQIFLTPASSDERHNEMTWAQKKILILLEEYGSLKMSEIARQISVTMPSATAIIEKMVKAELVQRETDPHDRRVIRIVLSGRGRELVAECMKMQAEVFTTILERLDADKRTELLAAFERIRLLLGEVQRATPVVSNTPNSNADEAVSPSAN